MNIHYILIYKMVIEHHLSMLIVLIMIYNDFGYLYINKIYIKEQIKINIPSQCTIYNRNTTNYCSNTINIDSNYYIKECNDKYIYEICRRHNDFISLCDIKCYNQLTFINKIQLLSHINVID